MFSVRQRLCLKPWRSHDVLAIHVTPGTSGSPRARTSSDVPPSCRWKPRLARARSFPFSPASWTRWHWDFQKVAKDRGRNGRNCCAGKLHCNRINHRRATGVAFFSFPFLLREWDRAWPRRQTPDRLLYLNMKILTGKNNSLVLRCEKFVFSLWNWPCLETVFPTAFGTNTQPRTIYTSLNPWLTMPVSFLNHLHCKRNTA